jgi:hypothetical protein
MDNIKLSLADPVRSLLDDIANVDPKTRLHLYATARIELTAGDLAECRRAHPDAGYWLSLRAEAGPPGQALPSRSEALNRLQAGEASLEDVASWLLTPGGEIVEPDTLIPLHQDALAVALRADALLFVRRSSRALAVLSFLVADPEAPRSSLRRLNEAQRYRPLIAQWQALVDAVEGSAALRDNPWIRVAAANFWTNSGTEVPARIDVNPWLAAALNVDPSPVLAALGEAEIPPFEGSLTDIISLLIYEQLSAHPVVGRLRRIANYGGRTSKSCAGSIRQRPWLPGSSQQHDAINTRRLASPRGCCTNTTNSPQTSSARLSSALPTPKICRSSPSMPPMTRCEKPSLG